jgi:hypothetical protein
VFAGTLPGAVYPGVVTAGVVPPVNGALGGGTGWSPPVPPVDGVTPAFG